MMKKFISLKKQSKKKQREENNKRRNWGGLNPVTRKPPNPKAYRRTKAKKSANDAIKREF